MILAGCHDGTVILFYHNNLLVIYDCLKYCDISWSSCIVRFFISMNDLVIQICTSQVALWKFAIHTTCEGI